MSYDAIDENNITEALCLLDSQYVWEGFEAICKKYDLSPKAYNIGLKDAWSRGVATGIAIPFFLKADGKLMMNEEELDYYNNLPEEVTIYRGCSIYEVEPNEEDESPSCLGISWTTSRKVAEFFAFRNDAEERVVVSTTIPKSDILTFINNRNEYECICLAIDEEKAEIVAGEPTELYDEYLEEKEQRYKMFLGKVDSEEDSDDGILQPIPEDVEAELDKVLDEEDID